MKISAIASLSVLCLALSGCGGGGDSAGGGAGIVTSKRATDAGLITSARALRLATSMVQGVLLPALSGPANPKPQFDGNLYYTSTLSGNVLTIHYFTDAALTKPAGNITITRPANTSVYPQSWQIAVAITGGAHPTSGNFTYTQSAVSSAELTSSGQLIMSGGAASFPTMTLNFNLASTSAQSAFHGNMTALSGGYTTAMPNLVKGAQTSGTGTSFTSGFNVNPGSVKSSVTRASTLNIDGSGKIVLSDGSTASWNPAGKGLIVNADHSTVSVASFDKGA